MGKAHTVNVAVAGVLLTGGGGEGGVTLEVHQRFSDGSPTTIEV